MYTKKLKFEVLVTFLERRKICLLSKNSSKSCALKSLDFGMHHVQLVLPKLFYSFAFLTQSPFLSYGKTPSSEKKCRFTVRKKNSVGVALERERRTTLGSKDVFIDQLTKSH